MEFGAASPADSEAFERVEQRRLDAATELARPLDVRGAPAGDDGRIRRLRSSRRLGSESVSLVAERYGLGPRSQVYGRTWISA